MLRASVDRQAVREQDVTGIPTFDPTVTNKGVIMARIRWIMIVMGAVVALSGCAGTNDPVNVKYDATNACENWVKNELKSPATADFSNEVVNDDPSAAQPAFTITGAVDADNSFGAKLRNTWTCSIHTDGDSWRGNATLG
jgi:hypothetical protein